MTEVVIKEYDIGKTRDMNKLESIFNRTSDKEISAASISHDGIDEQTCEEINSIAMRYFSRVYIIDKSTKPVR